MEFRISPFENPKLSHRSNANGACESLHRVASSAQYPSIAPNKTSEDAQGSAVKKTLDNLSNDNHEDVIYCAIACEHNSHVPKECLQRPVTTSLQYGASYLFRDRTTASSVHSRPSFTFCQNPAVKDSVLNEASEETSSNISYETMKTSASNVSTCPLHPSTTPFANSGNIQVQSFSTDCIDDAECFAFREDPFDDAVNSTLFHIPCEHDSDMLEEWSVVDADACDLDDIANIANVVAKAGKYKVSGDALCMSRSRMNAGSDVTLHVYDLSPWTRSSELPFYHVGVQVYDYEYFFCSIGIQSCLPTRNANHVFKKSVKLGKTSFTLLEVFGVLNQLNGDWGLDSYRMVGHNCQSFAVAFCQKLGFAVPSEYVRFSTDLSSQLADAMTGAMDWMVPQPCLNERCSASYADTECTFTHQQDQSTNNRRPPTGKLADASLLEIDPDLGDSIPVESLPEMLRKPRRSVQV